MAQVKVLLLKPLKHHGDEGSIISVKAGYARNRLIPGGFAKLASGANEKQVQALCRIRALREAKELEAAKALAEKIQATQLTIAVKTGEQGKLFGSVCASDLMKRYEAEGIVFDKDCLRFGQPIKQLGKHSFQVRLHKDVVLDLSVEVVSENPL